MIWFVKDNYSHFAVKFFFQFIIQCFSSLLFKTKFFHTVIHYFQKSLSDILLDHDLAYTHSLFGKNPKCWDKIISSYGGTLFLSNILAKCLNKF